MKDKVERAKDLLLKASPDRLTLNGQKVVIMTEVAYRMLLKILESK